MKCKNILLGIGMQIVENSKFLFDKTKYISKQLSFFLLEAKQ